MSAYNNQNTLQEAIDSVLGQSFADFEFIIVNDGSIDSTEKIIRENMSRDKRVLLIQQANIGLTKSLNAGLAVAKGEYIARQDADDISFPERFQEQIKLLDSNKNIGFTGCDCEVVDEHGELINIVRIKNNPGKNKSELIVNNVFCHGSMMFRKVHLDRIRGYREFFKYAQDYDLYLRLLDLGLPGSVNKTLYRRRLGLDGISVQNIHLQAAYSTLAKKCYQARSSDQNDTFLLTDSALKEVKIPGYYDNLPLLMQAFNYVKHNEIDKARIIIRPYLAPVRLSKYKIYLLWLFSHLPARLRKSVLDLRSAYRKSRIANIRT